MTRLVDLVGNNQQVRFLCADATHLWYATDTDFVVPVPRDDVGDATFAARDKALLFMRYVRRQIDQEPLALPQAPEVRGETVVFTHLRHNVFWYEAPDGTAFPVENGPPDRVLWAREDLSNPLIQDALRAHQATLHHARAAQAGGRP